MLRMHTLFDSQSYNKIRCSTVGETGQRPRYHIERGLRKPNKNDY